MDSDLLSDSIHQKTEKIIFKILEGRKWNREIEVVSSLPWSCCSDFENNKMPDVMDTNSEFFMCLQKIVQGDDHAKAWKDLFKIANPELSKKHSTYDSNMNYDKYLRAILTQEPIRNVDQIHELLLWFSNFPLPFNACKPISKDIAICLEKSVKFFKDKPFLADIIQVINNNLDKYLPKYKDHAELCKAIVQVLSWMPVPEKIKEIEKYTKDLIIIRDFLKMICNRKLCNSQINIQLLCYTELRNIFWDSDREEDPSPALVIVLQVAEDKLWNEGMPYIVENISKCPDHKKIVKMLSLFCQWMTKPPSSNMEYLNSWLTLFIKALEKNGDMSISMRVAECTVPLILLDCLKRDDFSNNIVLHLMQRIQSEGCIHNVSVKLFEFAGSLNSQISKTKRDIEMIKFTVSIANKFIQNFAKQRRTDCAFCTKMMMMLFEIERQVNKNCSNTHWTPEMEICQPSTSRGYGKLDTSKVGLQNLGNTCYMNSVLQALVMTRKFCHEVLLYKTTNDLNDQTVLKNLQNLFALLKYSERKSLAPTAILLASRPAYFTPGQQQDSSEFLCYLLDVMFEQEKSALMHCSNRDQGGSAKSKLEDKEMMVVDELPVASNSPMNDDGTSPNMTRWTTEENLCEGASLERKTQSLADFSQGEDLAQTQIALSDSHSDSTDSGIQSVGGEDSTSSSTSTSSSSALSSSSYLVHRVFGGELKVIYQCMQCGTESHNTDQFRDLQLCFLDILTDIITVQDLINVNYFNPEKLTGDNKYRCDKCSRLCDAERIIKIVQAPEHLILTLKHFRYDSESRLRTKLRCKVHYDEIVRLPVLDKQNESYQLYAAVVHSGYSMDYGHYITYACDAKNCWYKFNDSFIMQTTLEDFTRLEPPDTPYILFYKRQTMNDDQQDAPELTSLSKSLQEYIDKDRRKTDDERRITRLSMSGHAISKFNSRNSWDRHDDDGQGSMPPSNCGDPMAIPHQRYLF